MSEGMMTLRGGWSFNMERSWMSEGERNTFKTLRDSGAITFYRTASCEAPECDSEIPKGKSYCSAKCMEAVEGKENGHEEIDGDDW